MFDITYFASKYDNIVEQRDYLTWHEIIDLFSEHRKVKEKNDIGFTMAKYKHPGPGVKEAKVPGSTDGSTIPNSVGRYHDNIESINSIVVDYDSGISIKEVRQLLTNVKHLGYTSFSHLQDGETAKFRVIIPLKSPVSEEFWKLRIQGLLQYFSRCDLTTFSVGRIFYMPCTALDEDRPVEFWHEEGEYFDFDVIPITVIPVFEPKPLPLTSKDATGRVIRGTLNALQLFTQEGLNPVLSDAAEGKYKVTCPNYQTHTKQDKTGTVIWSGVPGKRDGFHCAHSSCKGKWFTDLFTQEKLDEYCEREVDGLGFVKSAPKSIIEVDVNDGTVDVTLPDTRKFSKISPQDERRMRLKGFVKRCLSRTLTHHVLRTPEGYGKSTVIVDELLHQKKKIIFCCSSNAQANEKVKSFGILGAKRAWSTSALIENELGIKPIMKDGKKTWDIPSLDIEATAELISKELDCTIQDATEAVLRIKEEAKYSRNINLGHKVIVTTFAAAYQMFKNENGRTGYTIVVDDPNVSDFITYKYAFEKEGESFTVPQIIEERLPSDVVFGSEFAYQDKIIYTTTELLVQEIIKYQHPGTYSEDIVENLDTEDNILLHPTRLVRKDLKRFLRGMHSCIENDTDCKTLFFANGIKSENNLVSSKGRNDLKSDSAIVISYPHPLEVLATVKSLGRDESDSYKVMVQMVVDILNQVLGRGHGYRSNEYKSIVLVEPKLLVSVQYNCRYKLTQFDGMKRKGKLRGIPVEWPVQIPIWWASWTAYIQTWEQFVTVIGDKVYNTLTLQVLSKDANDLKNFKKRLDGPVKFEHAFWKHVREQVDGLSEDRRNYMIDINLLISEFNEIVKADSLSKQTDKTKLIGRKKYISPNGVTKMYPEDKQPAGWVKCVPVKKKRYVKKTKSK